VEARYGSFAVRTQCPHCGQPLPLQGPRLRCSCTYCLNDVELPAGLWPPILDAFEERAPPLHEGERALVNMTVEGMAIHLEVGRELPRCEKCNTTYTVDALRVGEDRNFACVACGDLASTHAAPSWLSERVPTARQTYSTEADPRLDGGTPVSPERAIRPVVMGCPQCGGSLQATPQSPRILACRYCTADVYLPDEVWRRLHPVETVRRWYMRFEGKTRSELAREREAQEARRRRDDARHRTQREAQARGLAQQKKAQEVADLTRRGWRSAWTLTATMLVGIAVNAGMAGLLDAGHMGRTLAVGVAGSIAVVCLVSIVVATHRVGQPIQRATGHDGDWMIFCTWFWLPFVMFFPLIGTVMGLARTWVLARGKFSGATITSNGSSRSYSATTLSAGEGRPAALVFAALALLWLPLAVSTLIVLAT
jgi:hypothetical protein